MNPERSFESVHFVEECGLMFEMMGLPRMAGRIFGWLLICNPPHQSTGDLAEVLQASKGSISTITRMLIQVGLIERVSLPSQRRDFFRIRLNAWPQMTQQRLVQITAFRQLAEKGLMLLDGESPQLLQRLEEMRDMHAFMEQELRTMIDRWEQQRSSQKGIEGVGTGALPRPNQTPPESVSMIAPVIN